MLNRTARRRRHNGWSETVNFLNRLHGFKAVVPLRPFGITPQQFRIIVSTASWPWFCCGGRQGDTAVFPLAVSTDSRPWFCSGEVCTYIPVGNSFMSPQLKAMTPLRPDGPQVHAAERAGLRGYKAVVPLGPSLDWMWATKNAVSTATKVVVPLRPGLLGRIHVR